MKRTANDKLIQSVVAVLKCQVLLLVLALIFIVFYCWYANQPLWAKPLWSFLYGAVLAMLATLISATSARRVGNAAYNRSPAAMTAVYWGALNKLVLVAAGVTIAFMKFSLNPLWLLGGFLLMHVAQIMVGVRQKTF